MRKPFLAGLAISRSLKPTKVAMATIPMVSAAWAQAGEIAAPGPLNETKPAEDSGEGDGHRRARDDAGSRQQRG
jgi:hypothetical protein